MRNILLLATFAITSHLFAQNITSNLEAWYKFDYIPGNTQIKDYSGNNRSLVPMNYGIQADWTTSLSWGKSNIASGVNSYISFPAGRNGNICLTSKDNQDWFGVLGSTARTLAVWIKIETGAADFNGTYLYAYGDDTKIGGRYEVSLKGHSIEFENAANTQANDWKNRNVAYLQDTDYPQNTWHHLAIVYNGMGDRQTGFSLYLNGKLVAFNPVNITNADFSINTIKQNAPQIGTNMEKMSLADLRFYSRALTRTEIEMLRNGGTVLQLPHTIETISSLLNDAIVNKAKEVVIPKGEYRGNTGFILLKNASDLKIIADSVTMICEKRVRALEFYNCKNVTLQGLTIDYDPLPYTQGDIVAVGNNYIDVKIHKGYPVEAFSRVDVIDKQTRFRKRGSVFVWNSSAKIIGIGGDIVRITNTDSPNLTSVTEVGDMATLSGLADQGAVHTLVLTDCQGGMVLKNVTVNTGPGFGIFETGGIGGTILDGCKIRLGPKPRGATEERLLTTIWDAIQHKLTKIGPVVQNCKIESAGDDSWSVTWDGDYEILTTTGNTITVTPVNLQVGDSLRTSLTSESVVITNNTGGILTLNKPCPWGVKTRLFSPSRRCEHFIFRNNNIHNSGRGVLVKSGHGVIENNIFDNTHSGVTVNTELSDGGATGIDSLIIRNNLIIGTGHFMPASYSKQAGAISIVDISNGKIKPAGSFTNILIEKNIFKDVSGVNIVVTSSSNVNIKENKFYETGMTTPNVTGQDYHLSQSTVVYMNTCNKLTLDSNIVYKMGLNSLQEKYGITNYIPKRGEIFEVRETDLLRKLYIKVIGVPDAMISIRGDTLYDRIIDGYLFNEFELGTKHNITITPQKVEFTFLPASYQLPELLDNNTFSFLAVPDNITNIEERNLIGGCKIFAANMNIYILFENTSPSVISVYNLQGMLVKTIWSNQMQNAIRINRGGIYIVQIISKGKHYSQKVFVRL